MERQPTTEENAEERMHAPEPVLELSIAMAALAVMAACYPWLRMGCVILYTAVALAICVLMLVRKPTGSLAAFSETVTMFVADIFFGAAYPEGIDYTANGRIWLLSGVFALLLLIPLLIGERRVPPALTHGWKFRWRALLMCVLMLFHCFVWVQTTNVVFDRSAGETATAQITEKQKKSWVRSPSWKYTISVQRAGKINEFEVEREVYAALSEGDAVTLTEHPGFWGATYWTWKFPDDDAPSGEKSTESAEKSAESP